MKKAKIINGIVWAVIAIVLDCMVWYYCQQMGCELKSLVLGVIQYTLFCLCFWGCVHNHLTEREKQVF